MNSSPISDLSLYQLTQRLPTPPYPLNVQVATFQSLFKGVLALLIQKGVRATLWAKLPQQLPWIEAIEQYEQTGLAQQIYLCSMSKGLIPALSPRTGISQENLSITPILLESSLQLQREYFLMVLSPNFSLVLLIQEPPSAEELVPQRSHLVKLIYSLTPAVIERVLEGIKQAIVITDTTPEEVMMEAVLAFPLPQQVDASLLTELLCKNILPLETPCQDLSVSLPPQSSFTSLNEEFFNSLLRELSLPLTNMKTALRLLESMQHKRELRKRYLELLDRECDRQNSLLSGLQELNQINQPVDAGELSVKLEDCVPGIVSIYQPIAEEKGILLGYTIPAGFPAVACPVPWLKQLLRQLLHNSLKFTPSGGRVQVQASLKNDGVELTVNDTGVGIDANDIPKLFQSFYRGRNGISNELSGVGLGLVIVKQLIDRCGGKISVTSQIGKGTNFKILFPIA